jgi:hypothetical protein
MNCGVHWRRHLIGAIDAEEDEVTGATRLDGWATTATPDAGGRTRPPPLVLGYTARFPHPAREPCGAFSEVRVAGRYPAQGGPRTEYSIR